MVARLIASLALAGALIASPAYAKKKPAPAPTAETTAPADAAAPAPAATPTPAPAPETPAVTDFTIDFDQTHDPDNVLLLDLSDGGRVAIRLEPKWAPGTVDRIKTLARQGFYDGIIFHRVIDGFMAQTGDPTGTGEGGSKLPDLKAEFNRAPHLRGTVSMARTDSPDSANSQFFIMFYPRFALDQKYTNFGRVIAGMDYVDAIERGEPPAAPTRILQASLASDNKPPKLAAPVAPVAAAAPAGETVTADMLNASKPNTGLKPTPKTSAKPGPKAKPTTE